jgi:hypothetical protein
MKRLLLLTCFLAPASFAQIVSSTPRGIVVAHDRRIELTNGWSVEGVEHETAIVTGEGRVAVLDALNNEAVVVELVNGKATRFRTAETPIDGAFAGGNFYVLCRDARLVRRFPGSQTYRTDPDPAFIRQSSGRIFVYSRASGTVEHLGGARATLAPFASDFEISGNTGYLTFPREARIRTLDVRSMKTIGEIKVGAVPVDLAFAGGGTAITARVLAVADPSAKRVWLTESTQSTTQAIARGFLRGFLGLGLFGARSSQFPTGVDRVLISGKTWLAYDTSSATLYRFTKSSARVIAKGIAPHAFAATPTGIAYWQNGRVRFAKSV